jgi:hypothetical protein
MLQVRTSRLTVTSFNTTTFIWLGRLSPDGDEFYLALALTLRHAPQLYLTECGFMCSWASVQA